MTPVQRISANQWAAISSPLFLGWNAQTGRRVFVTPKQRATHMMDIGRSGAGKTTNYEFMIRQDIRQGRGVCVIDPEGTIYQRLLHYCAKRRDTWDRLVLIDPNDNTYRFGLNYFDIPYLTPAQRVDAFIQACYRILKQTDQGVMVQFQRWGDAAALPLASYPPEALTMAELHKFLVDSVFREAVLAQLPHRAHAVQEWKHWNENLNKADKQFAILSVLNRAALFKKDDRAEEILGQPNRIDWLDAMDRGAIVLVNLQPDKITDELSQNIGIMLIHQILAAGRRRPEDLRNRPFYVYVDELASMATPDFAAAFKRLRKRSVPFVVAMQELKDLDLDDRDKLRTAVVNSSDTKLVFGMQDQDEAEKLAKMLFASEIANDNIKFQAPDVTYAVPIAMAREVEEVSRTTASTRGSSRGGGRGETQSSGRSEGTAFNPDTDELLMTSGLNFGAGSMSQESWQDSSTEAESETRRSVTERWTEFEYHQQPQTPVYYTPDEMVKKYAAGIMRQPIGHALLKYDVQKPAVLIRTPAPGSAEFPDVVAGPTLLNQCREYVYQRLQIPTAVQARAEIEARQARVLDLPPPPPAALPAATRAPLDPTASVRNRRASLAPKPPLQ